MAGGRGSRRGARSSSLADTDAEALVDSCRAGARFAEASDADLAALEAAFAPLYAKLDQHPETKAFIERIQELKQSTPPEPELAIPLGLHRHGPGASRRWHGDGAAYLNGTYRFVLTKEDARKAGEPESDGFPREHLDR